MKLLVIKGAALAALVTASLVLIFLVPLPYSDDLAAIVNKRELLRDSREAPVIFIGGSGLFDGLDSGLVQERLRRPVVNMGLYAGFGITAVLREIKPLVRPGSVVVIVPEYGVLFDEHDFQARKWLFALSPARNLGSLYSSVPDRGLVFLVDVLGLVRSKLQALPKLLTELVRTRGRYGLPGPGYVYYNRYFNGYGDSLRTMRAAVPGQIEQKGAELFADARYEKQSLEELNAFCSYAGKQGAAAYFVFPAYPRDEYLRQQEGMRRYEARLRRELDCPILGTPEDFLYPYELFTNTVNHINSEGRRLRTEKLLSYLGKAMGARPRQ